MIKLKKISTLIAKNLCNFNASQIIEILLVLYNAYIIFGN